MTCVPKISSQLPGLRNADCFLEKRKNKEVTEYHIKQYLMVRLQL